MTKKRIRRQREANRMTNDWHGGHSWIDDAAPFTDDDFRRIQAYQIAHPHLTEAELSALQRRYEQPYGRLINVNLDAPRIDAWGD